MPESNPWWINDVVTLLVSSVIVVKLVESTLYSILYPVIDVMFVLRTGSSQIRITEEGEIGKVLRFFGEGVRDVEFDANASSMLLSVPATYNKLFFISNVSPDATAINNDKLKHKLIDRVLFKVQVFN